MVLKELKRLPPGVADLIERNILPYIPEKRRWRFNTFSLPLILQHQPTPKELQQTLRSIAKMLLQIPEEERRRFFTYGLPRALQPGKTLEQFRQQTELATYYFKRLGGGFFASKVLAENFGRLAHPTQPVNRLQFEKTGSVLIPLGGKLTGHLIRIITPKAFTAWQKAHEAGVPVEPILRSYKARNGLIRVYTRLVGERMLEHLEQNPGHREELEKQAILAKLKELDVVHGHPHKENFTVTVEGGKPKLHLIDWDQAVSQ